MKRILMILAAVFSLACGAAQTPAPGRFSECTVLSYVQKDPDSAASGSSSTGTVRKLLKSVASPSGTLERTWVVRSSSNSNVTYAVKQTVLAATGSQVELCSYTPNRVLVTLEKGESVATFTSRLAAKGLTVKYELMKDADGNAIYVVESSDSEHDVVETMTASIQDVGYGNGKIYPDTIYSICSVPNDPYWSDQWNMEKIGAPEAWDAISDASDVVVGVLDTGINYGNIDLNENLWKNPGEVSKGSNGVDDDGNGIVDDIYGVQCVGGNLSGNPMDDCKHGSHCAGIIGACGNNNVGVAGIAWAARIMGLKFCDANGNGGTVDAIRCLNYAEEHGARIINCSWIVKGQWDTPLAQKIEVMGLKGILFVCAAGNADKGEEPVDVDYEGPPTYPACFTHSNVISVAATDADDELAGFSYWGERSVDIAAPGVDVKSTVLGGMGFAPDSGTSMAAPHVTGALALLMAYYPDESPYALVQRLYDCAEPLDSLKGFVRTGKRLSLKGLFGLKPLGGADVTASLGTLQDAVVLYWNAVEGATFYSVYRSDSADGEKELLRDWKAGLTYSDTIAEPGKHYWYFIKAAISADGAGASPYSVGVQGWRMEPTTPTTVKVNFNAAGGSNPSEQEFELQGNYTDLPVSTKSGSVFLGWFTEAEGGVRIDATCAVREDLQILYAHWAADNEPRIENLFARQRYPWNGYVDIGFGLSGIPTDDTASVSLSAKNSATTFPVRTFVGKYPTNLINGIQSFVWNSTPDTGAQLYSNLSLVATITIDERKVVPTSLTIDGAAYVNAGETLALGCTVTYSDGSMKSVTAQWELVEGSDRASISAQGVLSASGTDKEVVVTVKAAYSEAGVELYATKSVAIKTISVTVFFDGNGGTSALASRSYVAYGAYDTLPSATRTGYAFAGWWSAATGGVKIDEATVVPKDSATFYAHWTANVYSVTLNKNGGSCTALTSYTYGVGATLPTPTKTGYTFGGWFASSTFGGNAQTGISATDIGNKTYYAKWIPNSYTINFAANGGGGSMGNLAMTYNVTKSLPANTFTNPGFRFVGWATSAGGSTVYSDGASVSNLTNVNAATVTLYAVWEAVETVPTLSISSGTSTEGVELSWTPVEGATKYLIYRSETDNLGSALQINWESGTNYVDEYNGAVGGKTYYYWVRSVVGSATNSFSVSKSGYRLVPDPQRITASKGTYSSFVYVTWNSASGATSYRVYRHTTPNRADAVLVKTTTSTYFSDSTVAAGTRYYYWVEADGENGSSPRGAYDTGYAGTLVAATEPTHATVGANYRIIDLSGGTGATSYPVYYLNEPPANGWTEEYKTTKLVMRLVPAGTFMMGSPEGEVGRDANEDMHEVTLTEPYYIGIFPVTAEQWKLVCTNVPSSLSNVGSFPADNISYNGVRGKTSGAKWPQSADVDETSFLGFLRKKTADGSFDLPTEAQWEMACRAGTDTAFNDGSDAVSELVDENLSSLGRYAHNGGANLNTSFYKVNVGLYKANALGIYDMHGLVGEWCRDWYAQNVSSLGDTDPVGPTSGWWGRVRRGGFDGFDASSCRSAARGYGSEGTVAGYGAPYGFRIISAVPGATGPDDFSLSSVLDNTTLTFSTGGDEPSWYGQSDYSSDGVSAARSGAIAGGKTTWFETLVSGAGTLTFKWWVSSESGFDRLELVVDGVVVSSISGTDMALWASVTKEIDGTGSHSIRWQYRKDSSVDRGLDAGFVDSVAWTPSSSAGDLYMIVDLSNGSMATNYPVTYLSEAPSGGWTDEFKTSKLVLRRIEPGTFTMGSPNDEIGREPFNAKETQHQVTLSRPYYAGIYEVTQQQMFLVLGTNVSYNTLGGNHPAENFGSNYLRGMSLGVGWPASSAVDADSFFGLLRQKTGLAGFDLPTEAQWEYACRAGTTTALNNGKNLVSADSDSALDDIAVYSLNRTVWGHAVVGSRSPNAWGLYDMHGNVSEYCLDWFSESMPSSAVTDPVGPAEGERRIYRGGNWGDSNAAECRSACRKGSWGYGTGASGGNNLVGARVFCNLTLPDDATKLCSLTISGASSVDAGKTTAYSAVATYSDGTIKGIVPVWSIVNGGSYGSLSSAGVFTAYGTAFEQTVEIAASYAEDGIAVAATNTVTILTVNVMVSFDGNGGTPSVSSVSRIAYGVYGNLPVASRSGYDFLGWYTERTGGTIVDSASTVPSANVVLFAHWKEIVTCMVTLDRQSGSGGTASVTATYGSAMPTITVPTRTGYTFGGYYTSTGGSGTQYYTSTGASAKTWDKTTATTLYAKWTAVGVTVTLNQQSGSGGTTSVTATYGSAMPTITVPTRTGYTFGGYYTSTGGSGTQYYTSAGVSAKTWDKTSETTLYAKWTAISTTITFDLQGGSGGTSSVTATYGSSMPTITVPTRTGYVFGGYYTATDGGGTQYYTSSGSSARSWNKTAATTLYAWWVADCSFGFVQDDSLRNYTAFNAWPCAMYLGTTNTIDSAEAKNFAPGTKVYMHFAWQNLGLTTVSDPLVKCEILTSSMSLVAMASLTHEHELEYGYATYVTGWTWGTIAGLSPGSYILRLSLDPEELIPDVDRSDNVITYAFNVDATGVKYGVTLDQQGGSGGTSSVTATYGSAMPSITIPSRTGYTFGGYYTSTGGSGTQYYTSSGTSARSWDKTSATTLYAKWTAKTATVTLDQQSGSGGTSSVTATYGSAMPSIALPTRSGYSFGGYFTSTGGSGTQYYNSDGSSTHAWDKTAATTLYAKWTKAEYTVTFDRQSGSGGSSSVTVQYGASMPSITVPTRTSYTFKGYYSAKNGGGTCYYNANGTGARTWNLNADTTLYAYWEGCLCTITFDKQGGTGGTTSIQATAGGRAPDITPPTKSGHKFIGYYSEKGGMGDWCFDSTGWGARCYVNGDMTVYAVWMPEEAGTYMVIDISGGKDATSYPVSYLSSVPSGGWTSTYKTTKIVLRRVEPGTFTMGSPQNEVGNDWVSGSDWIAKYGYGEDPHKVNITFPFYVGVFEVTQKQYELVTGNKPSKFQTSSGTSPVESVSWNTIRGSTTYYNLWPCDRFSRSEYWWGTVGENSFMGRLRMKTALACFDIPTEAQWEYACRAGTTTALNNGTNLSSKDCDSNLAKLGKYFNKPSGSAVTPGSTVEVGKYLANNWGLYDMHGNVEELCLDWYERQLGSDEVYNPVGPDSGTTKIARGGNYDNFAYACRSASRTSLAYPSEASQYTGFRLSCVATQK